MIIDTIKNITKYEASFPWLKRIGAILESPTLASLSDGAYQTDDASIVYAISSYKNRFCTVLLKMRLPSTSD